MMLKVGLFEKVTFDLRPVSWRNGLCRGHNSRNEQSLADSRKTGVAGARQPENRKVTVCSWQVNLLRHEGGRKDLQIINAI